MALERDRTRSERDSDVKRETDMHNAGVTDDVNVDRDRAGTTDRTLDRDRDLNPDRNRDPITGAPGSHPVGTGIGAAGGGAAGAAIGAAISGPAAPIGAVVGAVVGAVAGGLAGKGAAEAVNPTDEDAYWRDNYAQRPYIESGRTYDDYRPAYEYGWTTASQSHHKGKNFDDIEAELGQDWERFHGGKSNLQWDDARHATRDAWHRVSTGGADRDYTDRSRADTEVGTNAGTSGGFQGRAEASVNDPAGYPGGIGGAAVSGAASSTTQPGGSASGMLGSGTTSSAGSTLGTTDTLGSHGGEDAVMWNDDLDQSFRNDFGSRPYAGGGTYDEFRPAYQFGHRHRGRYQGRSFDEVEPDLRRDWERDNPTSSWDRAKHAVRDAWHRVERALPGDADRDGR